MRVSCGPTLVSLRCDKNRLPCKMRREEVSTVARSPLFRDLMKVFRTIRGAKQAGLPVREYAARREQSGWTRRQFLQATAATAVAVPLLNACGGEAAASTDARVAIVGGGIAGLHCAYRLKNAGVMATIYDANSRVGGRIFSDRETFKDPDGQHCELGGELIDSSHMTMRDLATELDIALFDFHTDDQSLTEAFYFDGKKIANADVLEAFEPVADKIDAALATLTDQNDLFVYFNKPNGGQALDALSIKGWFDKEGINGDIRKILDVAFNTEYGMESDVSNALNLLLLISTNTQELELFGESDERYHAATGNDTFITKLAAKLDPAQIELGTRLAAVKKKAGGDYTLTFQRDSATFEVDADHVVLALPFTMLRAVTLTEAGFSAQKLKAVNELGYGKNAKLMVGFGSRHWRTQGGNGAMFTDLAAQASWDTCRLQPGTSGIITNFTGGNHADTVVGQGTTAERAADFLNDYDKIFPGTKAAANGKSVRFHWPSYPLTLGAYSSYKVGQYTGIAGSEILREGNVHFCGEHTSLDAQGFMEGGAITGAMAAEEVMGDLGLNVPTALLSTEARRITARARAAQSARRWKAAVARQKRMRP